MITIELTGAIDAAGTLQTFYYSTDRFVTKPTDTPANTAFTPNVLDAGSIGVHSFSDGMTAGTTKFEVGEVVLANSDGSLDALLEYSFDGRSIVIRSGDPTDAYPSAWSTVYSGTMDGVEPTWDKIVIRMRDKQYILNLPVLTTTYAGNNSLPNGLEGTVDDLKGKVKCRTYGKVYNIVPNFVNTSKLTYQCNDGAVASIDAVYDKGAAFTPGADYANSTLLQAAATAAGTFDTCIAEGYFRLGTTPAGLVTADVTQGANAAARTVAQIVKSLALSAGLASGEISSADVTALDTANASVVGIYLNDETTFQAAMDQLLNSVGAYAGFDGPGVLRMGVLLTPTGTAVVSLQEYNIFDGIELRKPKNNGIPIWRAVVNHSKIYSVQGSDLAGGVTTPRRAYLQSEYRSIKSDDTSIKTQWLLSNEYSVNTLLTNSTDATTEANRLLALYKVRRDLLDIPCDASVFYDNSLKLGDVVEVVVDRFTYTSGKKFRLIGYNLDLTTNTVILQVWG